MNFNKKISTPIAILIIVVLAALVGGVFYWQHEKVKNIQEPNIKLKDKIGNPNFSGKDDWDTYTNKKYRFRFKYPSGWAVWDANERGIELDPLGNTRSVAGSQTGTDDVNMYAKKLPAYFSETKVETLEEFDEWLNKQITKNRFGEKKEITLGTEDYEGVKLTRLSKYQNKVIFLKNESGSFIYRVVLPSSYEEKEAYSVLISTFEFID